MKGHLDLARLPLQALIRAAIPDLHGAGAVLSLRDLAVEVEVLERMVLRCGGEVVFVRSLRQALWDRPRDEDATVLQTQVPVQPGCIVLLDDEPRCASRRGCAARGLPGTRGVAFGAIARELCRRLDLRTGRVFRVRVGGLLGFYAAGRRGPRRAGHCRLAG